MTNDHIPLNSHHEGLVNKTAHAIENRYSGGENLHSVLTDEIHHLRSHEYKHAHLDSKDYKQDLKALEHKLQEDHVLPRIHIHTSGKHIGSIESIGSHRGGHSGKAGHSGAEAQHHPVAHWDTSGASGAAGSDLRHHPATHKGQTDAESTRHFPKHYTWGGRSGPRASSDFNELPAPVAPTAPGGTGRSDATKPPPDETKPSQADVTAPPPARDRTADSNGQSLPQLKEAVARAKAEGRPINMVQIGDSHIEGGIETPALAKGLANKLGVQVNYAKEGIHGAQAKDALHNESYFLKDINKNTDLVVVSFGSNDSTTQAGSAYRQNYQHLIDDIKAKAPNASIVMVGPTDGAYSGKPNNELVGLDSVTAQQRAVANGVSNGSYFDIRSQMGLIASMRSHGWMANDNLHFNSTGYKVIGNEIADYIAGQAR